MTLAPQQEFCVRYNITQDQFSASKLDWKLLEAIHADYASRVQQLVPVASYVADTMRHCSEVHSLKFRVKNPDHLIEKIIRKRVQDASLAIELSTYDQTISDLIGVRALHLFKDGWQQIHAFILATWEIIGKPQANIRKGDSEELLDVYRKLECDLVEHPFGYRSVHYVIASRPQKVVHQVEIQVRTVFEEGWSEIDHNLRYPYARDDKILGGYLRMFNRLAGSADEMGTFIKLLVTELKARDEAHQGKISEKDRIIRELQEQVRGLKIGVEEKKALQKRIEELAIVSPGLASIASLGSAMSDWMKPLRIDTVEYLSTPPKG